MLGGRASRRAEGGSKCSPGFWERNSVEGKVSPIKHFHYFSILSNTLYRPDITYGRDYCRDKDGGTVVKGMANDDHGLVGTKRGKSVYEPPKYLRTELARNP